MQIKVRVRANARRESVEPISPVSFKISVREKAIENAANRRVAELVALHFKVPKASVRIVRGHRSPSKILSVG
ncbi:DUF167 domain-containing protein [Candidatus Kaiserbacteria bacterium]|nr:DUF167 domain-containing protein [Candidatus Kaiserbacteria bacterium]